MARSTARRRLQRGLATPLLAVGLATAAAPAPAGAQVPATVLEGESLVLEASAGRVQSDPGASADRSLLIWSDAAASGPVRLSAAARLTVRVRGDQCAGAPRMTVRVGDAVLLDAEVRSTSWSAQTASAVVPAGEHRISVAFTNDYRGGGCDRNLHLDRVTFAPTDANPLAGRRLDVEPGSLVARQVEAWRTSRPADARTLEKIATRPQATWFGAWSGDPRTAVRDRVAAAVSRGATPVLVAYNIPGRDCGGYSAGGSASADAYRTWIRGFADGLGSSPAVVVLEPDALAQLDCLPATERSSRTALLADAIGVLAARPRATVYVDAGHSGWIAADEMARRLRAVGAARIRGFSLNVSNFNRTADELAHARAIAARVPGTHAVIDTSRNGLGSNGEWCNPAGRALGAAPGAVSDPVIDAHLWVKRPGESDGTCAGGPSAGTWWPSYALGLAQRAAA